LDLVQLPPGWQTHLMFAAFDGHVEDAGDHLIVRTPASPGYYWGNFLLWDRLASNADLEPWLRRFDETIVKSHPGTGHVAFGMLGTATDYTAPAAFAAAGFAHYGITTLLLGPGQLRPLPREPDGAFEFRPLVLPDELDDVVALNLACNEDFEPGGYRRFRREQMLRYTRMQDAGMGHWWGAWHGDTLCASLGLFGPPGGGGLGRFQHVETHPSWRRRGLCRALVRAACTWGFERDGRAQLVMNADPDEVAIGIYRSVGFQPHDTLWELERRPAEDRPRP
jgi:ribosomal protein S18 acetylase RimI-like enzyme